MIAYGLIAAKLWLGGAWAGDDGQCGDVESRLRELDDMLIGESLGLCEKSKGVSPTDVLALQLEEIKLIKRCYPKTDLGESTRSRVKTCMDAAEFDSQKCENWWKDASVDVTGSMCSDLPDPPSLVVFGKEGTPEQGTEPDQDVDLDQGTGRGQTGGSPNPGETSAEGGDAGARKGRYIKERRGALAMYSVGGLVTAGGLTALVIGSVSFVYKRKDVVPQIKTLAIEAGINPDRAADPSDYEHECRGATNYEFATQLNERCGAAVRFHEMGRTSLIVGVAASAVGFAIIGAAVWKGRVVRRHKPMTRSGPRFSVGAGLGEVMVVMSHRF